MCFFSSKKRPKEKADKSHFLATANDLKEHDEHFCSLKKKKIQKVEALTSIQNVSLSEVLKNIPTYSKIDLLINSITNLEKVIAEQGIIIANLEKVLAEQRTMIDNLEKVIAEQGKTITNLETKIADHEKKISTLKVNTIQKF